MADLTPGQQRIEALRNGGFNDDEISQWRAQTTDTLNQGGFSQDEIRNYFGDKTPDTSAMKSVVKGNIQSQQQPQDQKQKREPIDPSPRPVEAKDVIDAMAAGWGNSFLGLLSSGGESPIQVSPNASVAQSFASNAAQILGDAPAIGAGLAVGNAVAGPAGATAGAFAVPAAMRKILIDHYQRGDITDAGEFARRAVGTAWEAAKGTATGLATYYTGGLGKAVGGTAGLLSGEIAAQTVVSNALEGRLPTKNDFINGAVAIGGLHAMGYATGKVSTLSSKLMGIYSETGAHPGDVIEAATNDPEFKGQLLSENPDLPKEAASAQAPEAPILEQAPKEAEATSEKLSSEEESIKAASDEIGSRIGQVEERDEPKLLSKQTLNDLWAKNLDYTSTVGQVLEKIGKDDINEDNAQVLMRLHNAVADKVRSFIENGTRDFKTGSVDGESYMDIVNDVKGLYPDAWNDFNKYRIATRSLDLSERGIEQPGSRENDQVFKIAHEDTMQPFMKRYVDYRNRVLDYLGDSGRYSKDSIQAMKDVGGESYAPLKKVLEPDELTGERPANSRDIKRIGNSDSDIIDPTLSDLRDISNMIRMAHETEATNAYIDAVKDNEDLIRVSENQSGMQSKSQIAGYEDGKRTLYDVDPDVADSIKRMAGNMPALNVWTGMMKQFTRALRFGTVNNPMFAIRHAWRQQLTAPTLSQTGLHIFQALAYAPEFLSKSEDYHNFVYDGGAVNSIVPLDQGYLDGKIYELNKEAPFLEQAWNTVKDVAGFSHMAITANDNIVRFAEYKRMLEKGATRKEAAFAAREVLPDFQRQGLQQSFIQQTVAFLNVHAQGQARMFEALGGDAQKFNDLIHGDVDPVEGLKALGTGYIAKNLAYLTTASVLLSAAQAGDDSLDDVPNWQRYNYWNVHIPNWRPAQSLSEAMSVKSAYPSNVRQMPDGSYQVNDGTIWRVQKPFTNGIFFGSGIEAILDSFKQKSPKAFMEFVKNVGGSMVPELIPTAYTPLIEQYVNRNFYTSQPLVRQSMENKLPEMQYDRYTSDTAKMLGQMLSYVPLVRDIGPHDAKITSPVVIENYMRAWSGTLGKYAIDGLDTAIRKAGLTPDPVKPTNKLSDIPFVQEFMIRYPDAKPQSVQDFEDRYQKANEVSNSVKMLMKQGDFEGAVQLQNRYAVNMEKLTGVDKSIQNMNASIQKTYQAPNIDPVQKRQLIDTMMFNIVSMAKEGNHLMDQFEQTVKMKQGGK